MSAILSANVLNILNLFCFNWLCEALVGVPAIISLVRFFAA